MNPRPTRSRATTPQLFALMLGAMAVLIAIGSVAGAAVLARTADVSDRLNDRIAPARTAVVQLGAALVDQENGVRGYLLSGERQFLDPYLAGIGAERDLTKQVRELLPDEPEVLAELDAVGAGAADWRSRFAEPTIAARDRDGAAAADSPLVAEGKTAFDALRARLAALQDQVERARTEGRAALGDARITRDRIFTAIIAGLLAGLLAIAVLLQLAVLRPLREVRAAVRRVADGDFEHRVPEPGPADLAQLAADVEAMRGRVVAALAESVSAGQQLRQQAVELQRSNSDLEQFAYVASHDLQEPLRKIASFCQMLQRRYGPRLDERAQQYIGFAVDGASRMQALINDLLAFSRVGRYYDNVMEVDLDATFARARGNLADSTATIECPPLPVVQGDPTLLAMLWQNLLSNAVKFRKPDAAPHIVVEASREDAEWHFAVRDNGIGIEAQFTDKIFVIFQRLHPRDEYPGTGIGLAICKRIVEYHGGRIWLDTTYADGARFCFTLPAPAVAEEPDQIPADAEPEAVDAVG